MHHMHHVSHASCVPASPGEPALFTTSLIYLSHMHHAVPRPMATQGLIHCLSFGGS